MTNKNFFEIKNVDFYVGGKAKVKDVSFKIENEGDIICLLGPSGIGKTTILRTIAGLEKIDNGSITLNGRIISSNEVNIEPENRNIVNTTTRYGDLEFCSSIPLKTKSS